MKASEPQLERRLDLPGTTNVRDVGGYLAIDDMAVATGKVFRGEVVTRRIGTDSRHGTWDPENSTDFRKLGLTTVVDLRSDREAESTLSAWAEATGAEPVRIPIAEGGEGADTDFVRQLLSGERATFTEADMTAFYVDILTSRAALFGDIVELVSHADRQPVLIHCTAGKDRTGLAVALIMELLGCHRDDVVSEYALTGALRPNRVSAYASLFLEAGVDPEAARALFETPAVSMHGALRHLDEHFGGPTMFLEQLGGMSKQTHQRLRRTLLEDDSRGLQRLSSMNTRPEGEGR